MKTTRIVIALMMFCSLSVSAQQEYSLSPRKNMENGTISCPVHSVKAGETVVGGNFLPMLLEYVLAGGFNAVREDVSQGGDGDAVGSGKKGVHGAVTTAAAANETGLEGTALDGLVRKFGNVIGSGLAERFGFTAGAGA